MSQGAPEGFVAQGVAGEVRRLVRLAVPVAGTQLVGMLLGVVDTIMLGRYSTDAMAASVAANAFVFSTMMFMNGVLFGLDPLIAQAHGAGRGDRAALALQRGTVLAALLALPCAALWLLIGPFMTLVRQDAALIPLAEGYAIALIPGLPCFLVASVLRQYLQGREIVLPALVITLVANGVNALANYALIFGHFGFEEMGIVGAGIASSVTRALSLLLLVAYVKVFRLHDGAWQPWSRAAFDPRGLRRVFAIGLPVALQVSAEMWAFNASTFIAGALGATAVAAHGVALNLASLSFMLPLGVSQAATTRVGNLIGAGRAREAQRSAWIALAMGAGVMTLSAVVFVVGREDLARIYTSDPVVVHYAATILPIAAAFQIFDGTQVVGSGVLRGMGRTLPAFVFNLVGYWCIGLPLGWWIGPGSHGGLEGIWWGLSLGLAIVALSLVAWIRRSGPASLAAHPPA